MARGGLLSGRNGVLAVLRGGARETSSFRERSFPVTPSLTRPRFVEKGSVVTSRRGLISGVSFSSFVGK